MLFQGKLVWKANAFLSFPVAFEWPKTSCFDTGMAFSNGAVVSPRPAAKCERLSPLIKECSRCRVKVVKVVQVGGCGE